MIWVIPKMDLLENGIYICGKHPLLLTKIRVSDPGPLGPFVLSFFQILKAIPSECQTIWTQGKPNVLLGLIWIQTVCKVYQQNTGRQRDLNQIALRICDEYQFLLV